MLTSSVSDTNFDVNVPSPSLKSQVKNELLLLPGERRGWWKKNDDNIHKQAIVNGAINNQQVNIMLDTGANLSIIDSNLACELGLEVEEFDASQPINGISDVPLMASGKTWIKITLGGRLVYYMEMWVGTFRASTRVILGTNFMRRAGVRLNMHNDSCALPDEEKLSLITNRNQNFNTRRYPLTLGRNLSIGPGDSFLIRANNSTQHRYTELWLTRTECWIPSIVYSDTGRLSGVKVTNVSTKMIHLNPFTMIGEWVECNTLPTIDPAVRPQSKKYIEWQLLVNESISTQEISNREENIRITIDNNIRQQTNLEKKDPPKALVTRDGIKYLSPRTDKSESSSNISSKSEIAMIYAMETKNDENDESIFVADTLEGRKVDQSLLNPELYIHEGNQLSAEQLKNQLAMLPELSHEETPPIDVQEADIGEDDTPESDKSKLRKIIFEFKDCFISSGNALPPPAKGVVCDIDVGNNKPIAQRARRVPPHLMGKLYELIKGLLRSGLIRYSKSDWASPIVIVMKKNKEDIRLCIDYRAVNALTKLMIYPMPLIEDLLEDFNATMWFISMDNASGYWAIPMTTRARLISAFICPLGLFEWLRMPQGLKNAPQIYQRVIDNALWGFVKRRTLEDGADDMQVIGELSEPQALEQFEIEKKNLEEMAIDGDISLSDDVFHNAQAVSAGTKPILYRRSYIDDVNFGAPSWDKLCQMLRNMLESFRYWGISISLPKSAFGKKKTEFVSHSIHIKGIGAEPRQLETILEMPFPRTLKAIQSFCGSLIYYHKFIENYATYASVLYELNETQLQQGSGLDNARNAFRLLKKKLVDAPLLVHADRGKPYSIILYTNSWAIGASICQEHDGKLLPVRFVSRVLKDAETRYADMEKEVLCLLKALEAGFNYLAGQKITVYARYSTLKWLYTSKSLSGRTCQWATMLSPWDLVIVRNNITPIGLTALLTASITPPEHLDIVLDSIAPSRALTKTKVYSTAKLSKQYNGYVATFDGAVQLKDPAQGASAAILWRLPEWDIIHAEYKCTPELTVNESEYQGLVQAMQIAKSYGIRDLKIFGDSKLAIFQTTGAYGCHKPNLEIWMNKAKIEAENFDRLELTHIPRRYNDSADYLTKKAIKEARNDKQSEDKVIVKEEQILNELKTINKLPQLLYENDQVEENLTQEVKDILSNIIDKIEEGSSINNLREINYLNKEEESNIFVMTRSTPKQEEKSTLELQQERLQRIRKAQDSEEWILKLKKFMMGKLEALTKADMKTCQKLDELFILDDRKTLYYRPYSKKGQEEIQLRLVVPNQLQHDILTAHHKELGTGGHQGIARTYEKIRRHYYWRGLHADVEKYVKSCFDCNSCKGKPEYMGQSPGNITPNRPFQVCAMDFAIPLPETYEGNMALLIVVCMFTGYLILVPMASTEAEEVAKVYMKYIYNRFGAQEVIRHDRDPRFMSKVFKAFNRMIKQKQRATLAYRPQANGHAERNVQTVIRAIKTYVEDADQKDWDQYCSGLELALNTSYHYEFGNTSQYLVYGWDPRTTIDAMVPPADKSGKEMTAWRWRNKIKRLHDYAIAHAHDIHLQLKRKRAEDHNKKIANKAKRTTITSYNAGEPVWIYFELVKPGLTKKLAHLWHGPFRISKKVNDFTYEIESGEKGRRFFPLIHISRLKPFRSKYKRPTNKAKVEDEIDFDEELLPEDSWKSAEPNEFEVREILDDRVIRPTRSGKLRKQYLIEWKGYDESSWVDESELDCGALLYEYDTRKKVANRFKGVQTADEDGVLI